MTRRASFLVLLLLAVSLPVRAQTSASASLEDLNRSLRDLSERVNPSVVQIFTTAYAPRPTREGVSDLFSLERGTGSGVIVDPSGLIVTNFHVIDGARRIQVLLHPTREELAERQSIVKQRGRAVPATVVGVDRETDLAVLTISVDRPLPALPFADSDAVAPGELVLAYGSPMGLATSVSLGVVSGTARQLAPESPMIYIQTDASINPGNSGGPLVNTRGEIVGINTLILSQSGGAEGIGFAAPSNIVRPGVQRLRESGKVRRRGRGGVAQTMTPDRPDALGLPRDYGVVLADVLPLGPAEKAGLQIGDVVLALDGKPMENGRQFDVNLYGKVPSETVTLEILRNAVQKSVRVQVRERSKDDLRFSDLVTREDNLVLELGILAVELTPEMRKRMPYLRIETGVIVGAIAGGVSRWDGGLQPGDIIHKVNRREVRHLADLRRLLGEVPSGSPLVLQVERGQRLQYIQADRQ